MLVSKLKPCKDKFTTRIRTGETETSLGNRLYYRDRNSSRREWITAAILELIHVMQATICQRVAITFVYGVAEWKITNHPQIRVDAFKLYQKRVKY